MKYFIIIASIFALAVLGHYINGKRVLLRKDSDTQLVSLKQAEEVKSDPLDQIKECAETMNDMTNMFMEMKDVLENVKKTMQEETIVSK